MMNHKGFEGFANHPVHLTSLSRWRRRGGGVVAAASSDKASGRYLMRADLIVGEQTHTNMVDELQRQMQVMWIYLVKLA